MSDKHKETLSTGPFHVPAFNPFNQDRLVIILKNPTNKPLEASAKIDVCPLPPVDPVSFPFNTAEETFFEFPETVVPAMSCTRIEVVIAPFIRSTLHVTTTGDYKVCDDIPVCGKLEISVTGGSGIVNAPGLINADPSLFFRYDNFVVCDKKHD
ncbi:hypothetical protein RB620_05655 [Paenibacillus sp. LHD-117]|uniref:hypothetical protein n=1 Tax=Paenibacillus sp. LHD-117 TaxID=3071412 RepID=UPI0027E0DA71|nr:hypothetical protein [Paenibacillus sp. LHD-117]MDQ6418922.1 hypothetical protein [Paenibacillus sp. LHD-117]